MFFLFFCVCASLILALTYLLSWRIYVLFAVRGQQIKYSVQLYFNNEMATICGSSCLKCDNLWNAVCCCCKRCQRQINWHFFFVFVLSCLFCCLSYKRQKKIRSFQSIDQAVNQPTRPGLNENEPTIRFFI